MEAEHLQRVTLPLGVVVLQLFVQRALAFVHVQRLLDQAQHLVLYGVDIAGDVGDLLVGQQVKDIFVVPPPGFLEPHPPVQAELLEVDMEFCQFVQQREELPGTTLLPGAVQLHEQFVKLLDLPVIGPDVQIQ